MSKSFIIYLLFINYSFIYHFYSPLLITNIPKNVQAYGADPDMLWRSAHDARKELSENNDIVHTVCLRSSLQNQVRNVLLNLLLFTLQNRSAN